LKKDAKKFNQLFGKKNKKGVDNPQQICYNEYIEKRKEVLKMRKAILDENKRVIGFEPMEEEMSEQAKAQRQKQVDYIAKKYGFNKGTE
jgi:GTP-sensing pleiotropic transcriptional regulator CodY